MCTSYEPETTPPPFRTFQTERIIRMANNTLLTKAIASADMCALLSIAFTFPDEVFAQALSKGAFKADLLGILDELEAGSATLHDVTQRIDQISGTNAPSFGEMRREYTRLYLSPSRTLLIYPYESAFLHVAEGKPDIPMLFIAKRTIEVEQWMRRLEALPETFNKEPVDSIWQELDFMRQLYASYANALHLEDPDAAESWLLEVVDFREKHLDAWAPLFMQRTEEEARLPLYGTLAWIACLAFDLI